MGAYPFVQQAHETGRPPSTKNSLLHRSYPNQQQLPVTGHPQSVIKAIQNYSPQPHSEHSSFLTASNEEVHFTIEIFTQDQLRKLLVKSAIPPRMIRQTILIV